MALTKVSRGLLTTSIVDNGNATAITIDASENVTFAGNVGIGTSSPSKGLHLNFSNDLAAIRFQNTANAKVWDLTPSIPGVANSGFSLHNVTDNTVPLHVDNSGNVGIGATTYEGSVTSNASSVWISSAGYISANINNDWGLGVNRTGTDGTLINLRKNGADIGSIGVVASNDLSVNATDELNLQVGGATKALIASNGSLYLYAQATGAGNADLRYNTSGGQVTYDTSSRLVKAEIEDIPYGLSTVMALSPKRYERTDSDNKLEVGFIADEVVEVVPELVGMMEKRFLTMNQEDTEVIAGSVEYNKMTAVLVKAIQELKEELNTATARITELENN